MHVDAILAIVIFILVISWSFTYYYGLFEKGDDLQKYAIETVGNKLIKYIEIDTYEIPVTYSAQDNLTNHVFYFDYLWKNGTGNSSKVYFDGSQITCELYNDKIYWRRSVESGNDYVFYVKYAAANLPKNCTAETYHSAVNKTKLIPMAEEKKAMISEQFMNDMAATSYYQFKSEQDIAEDFHIEIATETGTFTYGIPVPQNRNVYSATYKKQIWETGEEADIMINIW